IRGHLSESCHLLKLALALPGEECSSVRAKALLGAGSLIWTQAQVSEAQSLIREALDMFRAVSDRWGEGRALHAIGTAGAWGDDSYRAFHESIDIKRQIGDRWGLAHTLTNLANYSSSCGDWESYDRYLEESIYIRREIGDVWGISIALGNIVNRVA